MQNQPAMEPTFSQPPQRHDAENCSAPQPASTDGLPAPAHHPDHQEESVVKGEHLEGSSVLRLHEGVPDYDTYRYGYPPESGRLFGSGN